MSTHQAIQSASRRQFLKSSTVAVASAASVGISSRLSLARSAHAWGSDTIRIGLVGCGGRGTDAAIQAMNTTSGNVELAAVADVYENRIDDCLEGCARKHQEKIRVGDSGKFIGFDAFKHVMNSDVDMVLLATPPGFRPLHFEAAINAGKHVFMEKPVAVDSPGVRRVLRANELAKEKNLAVAVGLQRRHEEAYRETMQRLQDGAIGEIILARAYWNSGWLWCNPRQPKQKELDYQLRNWYYFNWLCGDHIVEQHIHNLDVINWLMDDYPTTAQGQGGRQVRIGPEHGQIYDHHFVEFTYANGTKMLSQCRHMPECWDNVSEHVHGTKGYADISAGRIVDLSGKEIFQSRGQRDGHQQEHHDLFASIRNGIIPNEGEFGAKSTMTAILGRLATYSGKELRWSDALNSKISLADIDLLTGMDDEAPVKPNSRGEYPVSSPGDHWKEVIDWDPQRSES